MILTGKAKEDFDDIYHPISRSEIYEHALIIEWFDSVGYFIEIVFIDDNVWKFNIHNDCTNVGFCEFFYNDRQEATKKAILKANDIYNKQV